MSDLESNEEPVVCYISRLAIQRTSTGTKEYALAERIKTVDSVLIRTQI